jgi:hypothetical protein
MRPARARPRLLALLLVPLLAIVSVARAEAFYLCAHDQVARRSCCCPRAEEPAPAAETSVDAACCCSIEERGAAAPVARSPERDSGGSHEAPPVAVAVTPVPDARPLAPIAVVETRSQAPPRSIARSSQHVVLQL